MEWEEGPASQPTRAGQGAALHCTALRLCAAVRLMIRIAACKSRSRAERSGGGLREKSAKWRATDEGDWEGRARSRRGGERERDVTRHCRID